MNQPNIRHQDNENLGAINEEVFLVIDYQEVGPLRWDDVYEKWSSGIIDASTLAWRSGLAEWQPLAWFDEFIQWESEKDQAEGWKPQAGRALRDLMLRDEATSSISNATDNFLETPEVGLDVFRDLPNLPKLKSTVTSWDNWGEITASTLPDVLFDTTARFIERTGPPSVKLVRTGFLFALFLAVGIWALDDTYQRFAPLSKYSQWPTHEQLYPQATPSLAFQEMELVPIILENAAFALKNNSDQSRSQKDLLKQTERNLEHAQTQNPIRRATRSSDDELLSVSRPSVSQSIKSSSASFTQKSIPTLNREQIVDHTKDNIATLGPCLKGAIDRGELNKGRHVLLLRWTITPSGSVQKPQLVGPANYLNKSFNACLTSQIQIWKFPPSQESSYVENFPIPFQVK